MQNAGPVDQVRRCLGTLAPRKVVTTIAHAGTPRANSANSLARACHLKVGCASTEDTAPDPGNRSSTVSVSGS